MFEIEQRLQDKGILMKDIVAAGMALYVSHGMSEPDAAVELDKNEYILRTTQQSVSAVTSTPSIQSYELLQNYPNPFNPSTEISFYLPKTENISLKIYDILGRELITLFEGKMEQGNQKIDFNSNRITGGITSGLYFYKLTTQNFSGVKKMMLVK